MNAIRAGFKERRHEMKYFKVFASFGTICFVLLWGITSYSADIPAIRDAKDSAERARVQALIAGAMKENALDWTGNMIEPKHADHVIPGFKEYYGLPQLKVNYTYGVSTEIVGRVDQVLKAGRIPPDITWMPAWDWYSDLIKQGKLMRYESPYYKEYTLSNEAGNSMPGYWVSDSYTSNPMWNIKELEKRGIKNFNPTSWFDFIDPKLSGYLCLSNLSVSNNSVTWAIGMKKAVGEDWFIKLGKFKPALWTKSQQGEAWVASGEYPIALTARTKAAQQLHESGMAIGLIWPKEGQVLTPFSPVIFASAPHPNTAKLFIDYVRSLPGTNRIAESGVGLIYGRSGVNVPEKERKFLPPSEKIKAIPMDWSKDTTNENFKANREWAKKIGVGY